MPFIVVKLLACGLCGVVKTDTQVVQMWWDDHVVYPEGWRWREVPSDWDPEHPVLDLCPDCFANPDWSNHRVR
jgi:hypothetical protein